MKQLSSLLECKLREIREDPNKFGPFQVWMQSNEDALAGLISQGDLLRLKRGDLPRVMNALTRLLPSCSACGKLWPRGAFSSRADHQACAQRVDMALADGVLRRTDRPAWVLSDVSQFGSDAYYGCVNCGAHWILVEPEREDNGLWDRIA